MGPDAWILNLDVEDELSTPRYQRPHAVAARIRGLAPRLTDLTTGAMTLVDDDDARAYARSNARPGAWARAWSCTPAATARIRAAGLEAPEWTPAPEVLAEVLHRRFATAHQLGWEASRWLTSHADLHTLLGEAPAGEAWRLKRARGYAGRGQRVVRGPQPTAEDTRWIEASLRDDGGLLAEPELEVQATLALHGYVSPTGERTLGTPTTQQVDARGAWRGTTPVQLERDLTARLVERAHRAAEALHARGYAGAWGVDALIGRWRGQPVEVLLGELNARYTMGWAIGMGSWRPPARWP
jgi:hypothetical protein